MDGYPVTSNAEAEFDFAKQTIGEIFGDHRFLTAPNPLTGSEDFSYVIEQVPGAFIMVGACPPGIDPFTAPYNHSARGGIRRRRNRRRHLAALRTSTQAAGLGRLAQPARAPSSGSRPAWPEWGEGGVGSQKVLRCLASLPITTPLASRRSKFSILVW